MEYPDQYKLDICEPDEEYKYVDTLDDHKCMNIPTLIVVILFFPIYIVLGCLAILFGQLEKGLTALLNRINKFLNDKYGGFE